MDYGSIISRSWHITWRYRALWVLGIFAGVSGCAAGGGSGGSGGGRSTGSGGGGTDPMPQFQQLWEQVDSFVPLLIGIGVLLFFMGVIWWIFAIASRGGLIVGVNAIEEGHPEPLARLWHVGFGRFWSLFGVDLMLALPMMIIGVLMLVFIGVPVLTSLIAGREPGAEVLAPICGSLAIGLPLSLVAAFVFGIMRLVAQRYVMLGGKGAVQSVKDSWRFFRARLKDSAIMWFLNAALNVAASFVLAIPAFLLGLVVAVPLVATIATERWSALAAGISVAVVLFTLLMLAYNAIWGTYTSSLWTLFFRQVTGMAPAVTAMPHPAPSGPGYAAYPSGPPMAPGYVPPENGYAPAPQPPTGGAWGPPIAEPQESEAPEQPPAPATEPAPPAPPSPPAG